MINFRFYAFIFVVLGSLPARAYVPEAAQIIRYQPQQWRLAKPYSAKGTATYGKSKMETFLEWNSPGNLRLTVRDIPGSFYADGSGSTSWVLSRADRRCTLKSDSLTVACSALSHWGAIEFSGSSEETVTALVENGLVHPDSAVYHETDARQSLKEAADRDVTPTLGSNGKTPVAALEIHGRNFQSEPEAEARPLLRYDPTFLAPLLMRFDSDGDVVTIAALSDLSLANRKTRYSPVLASRLEVSSGPIVRTTFIRQEPAPKNAAPAQSSRTATDISAFSNELSVEGQEFLKHLLLTH